MAIPVACPHCEHDFEIPDEFAGIKGKCPQCGNAFRAPRTAPPPPPNESDDLRSTEEASNARDTTAEASNSANKVAKETNTEESEAKSTDAISEPPTAIDAEFDPRNCAPPPVADATIEPNAPPISKPRTLATPRTLGIPAPLLAGGLILLFLFMVGGVAAAWWSQQLGRDGLFAVQAPPTTDGEVVATDDASDPLPAEQPTKIDAKTRRQIASVYGAGVVQVTATRTGAGQVFTQTGWVADRRGGLIATSYLPADRIAQVWVSIQDDDEPTGTRRIKAAGVIAENKATDFTLLQVDDAALSTELTITAATDLAANSPLLIGVDETDAWPAVWSRGLLQIASTGEPFLLAHTGRMAAAPAGAPLMNAAGEVVACNTLYDPEPNGQGRAIAAHWIRQAIADLSADPEVTPFADVESIASTDAADGAEIPDRPDRPKPLPADGPKMTSTELVSVIDETKKIVEAFNWIPKDAKQYESVQKLARLVNTGKRMEDDRRKSDSDRIAAGSAAQQILVDMSREPWPDDTNLALINHMSMYERNKEDAGYFGYGYFLQWMDEKIEDRNVALLQLIGSESFVAVPVSVKKTAIPPRSQWRLIGEIRADKTVPISAADGAGGFREVDAPVIEAKYIIGRPE